MSRRKRFSNHFFRTAVWKNQRPWEAGCGASRDIDAIACCGRADLELLPPETVDDLWLSDHASPAHQAELGENRQMIASLLRPGLPPNERDAATLYYVKQCSRRVRRRRFWEFQISNTQQPTPFCRERFYGKG